MKMFKILPIFILIFSISCEIYISEITSWQFSVNNSAKWYPAKIPSTLTQDLIDNGLIPKDIYFRDNFLVLYQYEVASVTYRTKFKVDKKYLTPQYTNIINFKGLDTHCDVFLNNKKILTSRNMFIESKINAQFLQQNDLEIRFNSSALYDIEMSKKFKQQQGFSLPANFSFTRKPAYQYGWDWGPRILTMGIWKPVIIKSYSGIGQITNVKINHLGLPKIDTDPIDINITFTVDLAKNYLFKKLQAIITIEKDNNLLVQSNKVYQTIISKDTIILRISKNTKDLIWWTWDLGNPTVLVVNITLTDSVDTIKKSIITGIRDVKVKQIEDSQGKSFSVNLNGLDIFMRGGNYIPPQMSMSRVPISTYEQTIKDAIFAKYNMIRVWGGGQFQNDIFYQLCDRNGILIWHDLMHACALYIPSYLEESKISEEIIQNVGRIDNHPSLAIWNGNNEVWIGWQEWGWQNNLSETQKQFVENQYNRLFKQIIPDSINKVGSTNFYWETSPSSSSNSPKTVKNGDIHFWRVWGGGTPIEEYEDYVGRFNSEYGMQSLPNIVTIQKFTSQTDRYQDSLIMRLHQRHPYGDKYMPMYTQYAGQSRDLQRYSYYSQVMQAYALEMAIGALRGNKPSCMGSLYWQLNDVWPCTTWSTVDYYHNYKASHYTVRKMYNPYLISVLHNKNTNRYEVILLNDYNKQFNTLNKIEVILFNGTVISSVITQRTLPALSKVSVRNVDVDQQYANQSFISVRSMNNYQQITQNMYFLVKPKDRVIMDPQLKINKKNMLDKSVVEISTTNVATYVWIRFREGGIKIIKDVSNNFMNIWPGETISIEVEGDSSGMDITCYELERLKQMSQGIIVSQS